jgi:hypothetical protein
MMCEDCEQDETLAVVYSRKVERRGWRAPAKAATAPRHENAVPSRGAGAAFSCEPPRRIDRGAEKG